MGRPRAARFVFKAWRRPRQSFTATSGSGETRGPGSARIGSVSDDPETLSRAFQSRDRRFEGRFVAGVVTTGVYCRPGCPAPLPKPRNVRFFPGAAAAEAEGFRPCRRCRPEASAGAPVLLGTGATVSRALRLIGEGNSGESVEELAERLGVGPRHLRRLFEEHLGAPPAAVVRTHRTHFARRLLDETDLPVTEVAGGAGFSSLRSFHRAILGTFGRPPRELRGKARRSRPDPGEPLRLRLPYREPFDWEALLGFLAARAIPRVEEVRDGTYRRTVRTERGAGLLAVRPSGGRSLEVSLPEQFAPRLLPIAARLERLFDLRADPATIAKDLSRDPLLSTLVARRPGLRIPGAWDPFETAVRAVLGQQVSVRGAVTLASRLVDRFGEGIPGLPAAGPCRLFPEPAALASADVEAIGVPGVRAGAVRGLAARVRDGAVDLSGSRGAEALEQELTAIAGIGAWTARYLSLRLLGEPDAFPDGDLALLRALRRLGEDPGPAGLSRRAEAWRPWRAYATLHLWTSEED
jgi:AraC family transcriptional regulator, regulatory protein of adaptative response / DNA-3-methyladenine glycosylase II